MLITVTEKPDAIRLNSVETSCRSGRALISANIRALRKAICSAYAWPEKVALGVALAIAIVMIVVWALLIICAGSMHDMRLNDAVFHWFASGEITLVLPLWLVLRAVRAAIR